jgi:uncharacterized protein YgiM (DUF1202 family)
MLLTLLLAGLLLAACNRGEAQSPPPTIRAPKPTFTPTVNEAAAAQTSQGQPAPAQAAQAQPVTDPNTAAPANQDGGQAQANAAPPAPPTGAKVVVNTPLVNARSGPGLDFDVVAVVERGEEFDITGKSADGQWWRVCCTADGETVWIIDQLVDTDGPVDAVPVVDASDVPAPVFSPGKVKAEVNIPLLNARSGPNATADLIAIVEGGETFDVLAANDARDWYQVCCVEGQEAWLAAEYVTIQGPAGSVPIFGQEPAQPQEVAAVDPASFTFDLTEQEQFAETTGVRIYLFATDDGARALEGYSALVTKDGQKKTVDEVSFGGQPGFTWPFQDARQRAQNWKVEFPGEAPAGVWVVQIIDGDGKPVGPAATFTLTADDPNQELYVRYERR